MDDNQPIDVARLLALVWGKLMIEKRYESAILTGLLGYLVSRGNNDDDFEKGAMSWIAKAVGELQGDSGKQAAASGAQPACSFCGRSEPEVRLAAGASALICDACVAALSEKFGPKKDA